MILYCLIPIILANLLFAAHVMRFNGMYWTLLILALLFTLFIRRDWILRLWQVLVGLAIIEWILTTIRFVQMRMTLEAPYIRLMFIMGAVILFNLFVLLWLQNKKLKRYYSGSKETINKPAT